jgi:GxxExxY protein
LKDIDSDLNALSEQAIGAAIAVHRELGAGFQEMTYQRALAIELTHRGIAFESEVPIQLTYRDKAIGEGRIDILVGRRLILELKATEPNPEKFKRQISVYLKATQLELGLIINFNVAVLKDGLSRVINTQR